MLQPDQIPSTGRTTQFQARQLGYESVEEFARELPERSIVVDIGAGISRLGHEVAALRPDITWKNIDPCYKQNDLFETALQHKPQNLELLIDDIVTGGANLKKLSRKVDLVYSYWLLPHLSLESDKAALAAAKNMYDLLEPNGKMMVGPVRRHGFGILSPVRYRGVKVYTKQTARQSVVEDVLKSTKLWWLPRVVQLLSNRHGVHFGMFFVGGKLRKSKGA